MEMNHSHDPNVNDNGRSWLFSRTGIATIVAVSVLGFLIYQGHGAHLLGLLPYLLILACPLMHIFMHGGHGGHHRHRDDDADTPPRRQAENTEKPTVAQKNDQQSKQHQHKHGGC